MDDVVIMTFALVYLGAWAVTTVIAFVASRRLADGSTSPFTSFCFSLLAGLVWPLMIIGMFEFSSVAVYSNANSRHHHRDVPDSWMTAGAFDNVIVPLR